MMILTRPTFLKGLSDRELWDFARAMSDISDSEYSEKQDKDFLRLSLGDRKLAKIWFQGLRYNHEDMIEAFKQAVQQQFSDVDTKNEPYRAAQKFMVEMMISQWENSVHNSKMMFDMLEVMNDNILKQKKIIHELGKALDPSQFKRKKKASGVTQLLRAQEKELKQATVLLQERLQKNDKISKWWEKRFKELENNGGSGTT